MAAKRENERIKAKLSVKTAVINAPGKLLLASVCAAVIAVITFFVFSPSLNDGFTNWDDNVYVQENPLVVTNSVPIIKIAETPVCGHYHPLTVLSLALNYQSGKLNPGGYHLENVIFHLLNTILVFFFIFLLARRNLFMAAIVSLFFGIHPMHVESVTWISERKDVLYVFFFVAGLITYLWYSATKKIAWYFFTLLLFILSCLSKEMAVVFPLVLFLIDYLNGVKWDKKIIIDKIPFFIIAIILVVIEVKIQLSNTVHYTKVYSVLQCLMFASYSAVMYIVKLFVPGKLSAFYPYPAVNNNNGIPLIFYFSPFLLIILLSVIAYFYRKKEKEIVFGLLFYFTTIALVVQFVPINPAILPDRYSYLSYIGLLFIAAHLINKVWHSKGGMALLKYPVMITIVIGAVMFSCQAYSRTQVWENSEVLWTDVLDNYPSVSQAYKARGDYYYSINEINKAMADYAKAIACDATYTGAYNNLGILYTNYGSNDSAIADFNKAIAFDSTYAEAYENLGLAYLKYSKNDLALADFTKAIKLDSAKGSSQYDIKIAFFNRSSLYFAEGKKDMALADITAVIKLDTGYVSAYTNRGIIYQKYGENRLAIRDFTKAIALDPSIANAYSNRALLYFTAGKNDSALSDLNKAIAHDSTSSLYYYARGFFYKSVNEYKKAIDDFTAGIQLNPPDVVLYYNMRAMCYSASNKYNEAIADFSRAIELNPFVPDFWFGRSLAESKTGLTEYAKADAIKGQQLQHSEIVNH